VSAAAWLNPAGGLRYHLRAYRFQRQLWQPFRWGLGEWLLGWQPPEKTLVLVGPSGGYCLQPFILERFERVICLEPDPVARAVFRRRISRAPLEHRPELGFITDDRLVEHPERLVALLEEVGDAAILFSNVIGQLKVLLGVSDRNAPEIVRAREAVREAIRGRSFASFHDRVSGRLRLDLDPPLLVDRRITDEEILTELYGVTGLGASLEAAELLDHLTEGTFPDDLPHAYFVWELIPGTFHLIEGVRRDGPAAASAEPEAS
jgi:hypothetical protein